jgi:hypothetical protein
MEIGETLYVTTRQDFRRWLQAHHADRDEIWLVRFKKASGKPTLDYADAVGSDLFCWLTTSRMMDAERTLCASTAEIKLDTRERGRMIATRKMTTLAGPPRI